MEKGVTVIICTHNGGVKLVETMRHLAEQNLPLDFKWEIILVDNNSTDNTIIKARDEWSKHQIAHVTFTIISEKKAGKLFAFQRGIAAAKYEYFTICDDDNWLDNDYLTTAFSGLESDAKIGAIGGETFAIIDHGEDFPFWFDEQKAAYAVGKQASATGDITRRGFLWGAGLTSRTALYKKMYQHVPSLLINENNIQILSAEDTEYCLRLILNGYTLFYSNNLKLKHYISANRLTLAYKNSLLQNFADAHKILEKYYLALKHSKVSNPSLLEKVRLSAITPIRLLVGENKGKQKTILHHLFPKLFKPDYFTSQIEEFMKH
ncbi:glycosyltransferase involved in cell wall biosynthesis [Pedobacter sp. UYP30]|uniref:glycosyltransferase n=1 Tax=Pedobacter sp. UYP30 TaxID=1756400 RepID=UPI003392EF52